MVHQGSLSNSKPESHRMSEDEIVQPEPVQTTSSGERSVRVTPEQKSGSGEQALEPTETTKRYPTRVRKKLNKYSEEFLRKLETDGAFSVELIDRDVDPLFHAGVPRPAQELSTSMNDAKREKNVNEGAYGTTPVALKAYEWFDDNYDSNTSSLTHAEVNTAIRQGKVAVKMATVNDPEELIEELMNGPHFGDDRDHGHTNMRILRKLCAMRGNPLREAHATATGTLSETDDDDAKEAVGTTAYVRGGLCLRDRVEIVKQIKASYDHVGIDVQDDVEARPGVDYAKC